jgi:hypothetical protein
VTIERIVTMDIPDADPRAHLYGLEAPVMWKPPKSRLYCWYMGSRQLIVDKTIKAGRKTLKLMVRILGNGQQKRE